MSIRHLVLVGGGHAHVHVLTAFGRNPHPSLRVTLVTQNLNAAYSGMLPGVVAGLYKAGEAQIDLARLAAATDTTFIQARATGLDRAARRVLCADGAPVRYDVVSFDVGSAPALETIPGAREHGIAVKPVGEFLEKFERLRAECRRADGPRRIVVIGGGAGGVELMLSLRTRLRADATADGRDPEVFSFTLVTDDMILPMHNARVRAAFRRLLSERGVTLMEGRKVTAVRADAIELADGVSLAADVALIVTQAGAPDWFRQTGLTLDRDGFIAVGTTLQSLNDEHVYAAGDCAGLVETPREKAGVYAVRAGPVLADNLRAAMEGAPLRAWRPPSRHLALISAGERYAVASWGGLKAEGAWVWRLKDWIDRRWVRMYQEFEKVPA